MSAPPHVLFISPQPFFEWRGSPIRVKFNLLALVTAGYQVDLLTFPVGADEPIEGVTLYRVWNPFKLKTVPIGPSLRKVYFDVFLLIKAFRLCRKNKYLVIHGVEEGGLIAVLLARYFKTASIFEKHSDPSSYRAGWAKNLFLRLYARVEHFSSRLADAVIGTGPGLVEQVKMMGVKTRTFHIPDIPSSQQEPKVDAAESLRGRFTTLSQQTVVTYVGSFAVYQGIDLLFAAIPIVARQCPDVKFVIIGGAPQEIEDRRQALAAMQVSDSVTFVGRVEPETLPTYLAASDILLSLRKSGLNTPLKVLDYMKAGRAILATDVPAHRLILDENIACLVDSNAAVFASRLLDLVRDENMRRTLGTAARAMYTRQFTFEHHCDRLAACYDYVLAQRRDDRGENNDK